MAAFPALCLCLGHTESELFMSRPLDPSSPQHANSWSAGLCAHHASMACHAVGLDHTALEKHKNLSLCKSSLQNKGEGTTFKILSNKEGEQSGGASAPGRDSALGLEPALLGDTCLRPLAFLHILGAGALTASVLDHFFKDVSRANSLGRQR